MARVLPSGLNTTAAAGARSLLPGWNATATILPVEEASGAPLRSRVATFHSCAEPAAVTVARVLPSGLKAAEL